MDGFTACRVVRRFSGVPINMLTERSKEADIPALVHITGACLGFFTTVRVASDARRWVISKANWGYDTGQSLENY